MPLALRSEAGTIRNNSHWLFDLLVEVTMARVYLETSFVSACVTPRSDTASMYRRQVSTDWWTGQRSAHELFIAEEVLTELSHPSFQHQSAANTMLEGIPLLSVNEDVRGLAKILVREKVMPAPVAGDAIHVAIATVYNIDFLLTWNIRHLANVNKRQHLEVVCRRAGFLAPQIVTPDVLWEFES